MVSGNSLQSFKTASEPEIVRIVERCLACEADRSEPWDSDAFADYQFNLSLGFEGGKRNPFRTSFFYQYKNVVSCPWLKSYELEPVFSRKIDAVNFLGENQVTSSTVDRRPG